MLYAGRNVLNRDHWALGTWPAGGLSTIVISVAPACSADCMELGTTLQISINLYFLLVVFLYLCICIIVQLELYFCLIRRKMTLLVMDTKSWPNCMSCLYYNANSFFITWIKSTLLTISCSVPTWAWQKLIIKLQKPVLLVVGGHGECVWLVCICWFLPAHKSV